MLGLCIYVIFALTVAEVRGHGRLLEPPSRASMWRRGFNTPKNYNDNQLFCGGFYHQWTVNDGKCGVCGDPWDGPREHEAGGKYATGTITRTYTEGATIDIEIQVTASHHGFFEFRLCPNNDPTKAVTQECLNQHLLHQPDGKTRVIEVGHAQMYRAQLVLPDGVTCSQCLLQWKWNTGNSYGCDAKRCCKGCGKQEQFYGCSDISIVSSHSNTDNIGGNQNWSGLTNVDHQIKSTPAPGQLSGNQAHQSNIQHPNQISTNQFLGQHVQSSLQAVHGFLPLNIANSQNHRPSEHVPSHGQQENLVPPPQGQANFPHLQHVDQSHFSPVHQGPAQSQGQVTQHGLQHLLVQGFLPINVGLQQVNGNLQQHQPALGHSQINQHVLGGRPFNSQVGQSQGSIIGFMPQNFGNFHQPQHQNPQHGQPQQHFPNNQHMTSNMHGSIDSSASGHMSVQSVHGFLPINTIAGNHQQGSTGSGSAQQPCRATPEYRAAYHMADQYCVAKCRQGQCPSAQYCLDSCRH